MSLFEIICRNSFYLERNVTKAEKIAEYKAHGNAFNKSYWAFVDSLVPGLMCPVSVIEAHTGEEYDFTKHIEPLVEEGLIYIRPFSNCFPHSESLRVAHLKRHGLVAGSDKVVHLQFYLGKVDPNRNKKFEDAWL